MVPSDPASVLEFHATTRRGRADRQAAVHPSFASAVREQTLRLREANGGHAARPPRLRAEDMTGTNSRKGP